MDHRANIIIGGLGPAAFGGLSLETFDLAKTFYNAEYPIYLRTKIHPAAEDIKARGINFESFDYIYEQTDTFESVYEKISDEIIKIAKENPHVLYLVPGHPLVAEKSCELILEKARKNDLKVSVMTAQSFLDPTFSLLKIDPLEKGFILADGCALEKLDINGIPMLFTQVYDQFKASDLKLFLLEKFNENLLINILWHAGADDERLITCKLSELDYFKEFDHLTSVYFDPDNYVTPFNKLDNIFHEVLGDHGCPWDKAQNHTSLKKYLMEEANEVCEAIDKEDMDNLCEELGDVLMQIFLHSIKAEQEGYFTLEDVMNNLADKMIRRHPHVFGNEKAITPEEVSALWNSIKAKEKAKN